MTTINAAKILRMENKIGSVEEGKKADLVAIEAGKNELNPLYGSKGLISNLVFSFNGDVSEVFVDGRRLVSDGKTVFPIENASNKVRGFVDLIKSD